MRMDLYPSAGDQRDAPPTVKRSEAHGQDLHELLTVEDLAALLKVSTSWVYERTRARQGRAGDPLPHIKIGKFVRFDRAAIQAYLERCRTT